MKYSTSNSRNKTSRQIKLIKRSGPWSVHVRWGSWIMININTRSCWNIITTERLTSHELKCFLFTEKLRNDANHLRMIHTSRQSTSVSSAFMENETLDTIGLRIIVSSKCFNIWPYSIQQLSLHADCPSKGICQRHSRNDKDFHCLKIHRHHWSRARWHIVFL